MSQRILVVDDEATVTSIIEFTLEAEGYQTGVARDGEAALEAIATQRPDLVLLDLGVPKLDGYEVCSRLRADPATADLPVIILSGRGHLEERERLAPLGIADFVVKPFSPRDLAARVRKALDGA